MDKKNIKLDSSKIMTSIEKKTKESIKKTAAKYRIDSPEDAVSVFRRIKQLFPARSRRISGSELITLIVIFLFFAMRMGIVDTVIDWVKENVFSENITEQVETDTSKTEEPNIYTVKWSEEFSPDNFNGTDSHIKIKNGLPSFNFVALTPNCYEFYPELDELGRCQSCSACLSTETMPAEDEKRGEIGMVKPAGWHTVKYDCIPDMYLFNRCHLIGWQLGAENANECNLVTGTRYMNLEMLEYENKVANYIRETGNHVEYRATPVYNGNDLVCSGLLLEAYSVEDCGEGVCFCEYFFNVQPGVVINYSTGESELDLDYIEGQMAA